MSGLDRADPALNQATETPPYRWRTHVVLNDGAVAELTELGPQDAPALSEFFTRLTDESKYARFFTVTPQLSRRELAQLTELDQLDQVGLVVRLADRIIAMGHFQRIEDSVAEVSVLVEDAHQGRGIAPLLVEHLAQAARDRGIDRFIAQVLPENHRIIATFEDAGYRVAKRLENGISVLDFPINPNDSAADVVQLKEHRADVAAIARLLRPRSLAVVGASRRENSVGRVLLRHLTDGDFTGRIYAVNPGASAVSGMPTYQRVSDIADEVDLAIVAVPAEGVREVIADCAAKGVPAAVIVSAGFAEVGPVGQTRQRELIEFARAHGVRILGPNTIGLLTTDPNIKMNASLSPVLPEPGRLSFFCQSGALGAAILEQVAHRGIGVSCFASAGNRVDLSGNDFLQYWEDDPSTEVVLLYLESLGNPRKFSRIARRVSRRKPIVALRSGRHTQGVPLGHAVRKLDVPSAAVDAMFGQAGVIQVANLDEMLDVAQLLAHQPLPSGNRLAVVSNSDALSVLAQDAAVDQGIELIAVTDLGPAATARDYALRLNDTLRRDDVDAVLTIYIPPVSVQSSDVAQVLAEVGQRAQKPVVSTFMAAEGVWDVQHGQVNRPTVGKPGSVPSYSSVQAAVTAIAHAARYAQWRAGDPSPTSELMTGNAESARSLLADAVRGHQRSKTLSREEATQLLAMYGIDLAPQGPQAPLENDWAQALLPTSAGLPVRLATEEHEFFGPLVSLSLAGTLSELLRDEVYGVPPMTPNDAWEMLTRLRSAPLLVGYQGSSPVSVDALSMLIAQVAALQHDLPQVSALILDPVLAAPEGAFVLDAEIEVRVHPEVRTELLARSRPGGHSDEESVELAP